MLSYSKNILTVLFLISSASVYSNPPQGCTVKTAQLPNGVKVINYTCPVNVKPPINKPLPKNCAAVPVINTRTPMTRTTMVVCKPIAKK